MLRWMQVWGRRDLNSGHRLSKTKRSNDMSEKHEIKVNQELSNSYIKYIFAKNKTRDGLKS